jgi:DNA-binding MarR family transcriptional regulator
VTDQDGTDTTDLVAAFDAVVRANASLVAQLSTRAGVHESGLRALVLISDTGYSTPTEVAGFLGLTSGAVTNLVDRLSSAGLLERTPNPTDRRGSLLRLRPAGEEVVTDYRHRYATMLRAVDAGHRGALQAVLNDLATGLFHQAADADPDAEAAGSDGSDGSADS